ncbi:hypothetical protein CFP56_019312 [Quercus suber]|uniref:Uncharacterized protein n=1 Tax=Quercus suber TaxID=58331 RepID=A0AAW0KH28_QUESU
MLRKAGGVQLGWVQLGGSGWFMKFLRDVVFYMLLHNKVLDVIHYDCGKLPCVSPCRELKN